MMQRGRKGSLSIVPGGATLPVTTIDPPSDLSEEQAAEFSAIVGTYPMEWFDSANVAMLVALVRHNSEERRLGKLLRDFDPEALKSIDGMKIYDMLSRNHERQSKAASQLMQKMRLTQLSKYRADKAHTMNKNNTGAKPWLSSEPSEE